VSPSSMTLTREMMESWGEVDVVNRVTWLIEHLTK
jgi:hypothetical protein